MEEILTRIPPETIAQIALALGVIYAVYRVLLVPRKGPKGEKLSAILMAGWKHDLEMAACERREVATRRFYEDQIAELRRQQEMRVGEVRGYRDEAVATNAELLKNLSNATKDIAVVLKVLESMSQDGQRPRPDG